MIRIKSCREHNLKGISLSLPREKLTVITGVAGAGKSSLVIDTLHAEATRRYIESLSGRARSGLSQLPRPDVDLIEGLMPALAVTEQTSRLTRRQTVGSQVEVSALLAILFAAAADQYSPASGRLLKRQVVEEMVEEVLRDYAPASRLQLLAPVERSANSFFATCQQLMKMGFVRLHAEGELGEVAEKTPWPEQPLVVVDRLVLREGVRARLGESLRLALSLGRGVAFLQEGQEGPLRPLTEVYLCIDSGKTYPPLSPADFNFASARGACPRCKGLGGQKGVLPEFLPSGVREIEQLLRGLPLSRRTPYLSAWKAYLARGQYSEHEAREGCDAALSIELPDSTRIEGRWKGLVNAIEADLEARGDESSLSDYSFVGWLVCTQCSGERLSPRSRAAKLKGFRFPELAQLPITSLRATLASWIFEGGTEPVAREIVPRIQSRLSCLQELGLGYLHLDRSGDTLSVGEAQRVQLAGEIGADLSGVLYLLDEPARGLHAADIALLGQALTSLRDKRNTLILVEQNQLLVALADHVVELGPGAGKQGGEIIFEGEYTKLAPTPPLPPRRPRERGDRTIQVQDISCHNIENIKLEIPLQQLVGFCGVSGSGKSSLLLDALAPLLRRQRAIERLVVVDQEPPPPSQRSMPATYLGVMTPLRQLYAQTPLARARGLTPRNFSLTSRGGRCERCEGRGRLRIEAELLPPLWTLCEVCQGRRYSFETLQIAWHGLSIADVLEMTADSAAPLFAPIPAIGDRLKMLTRLGVGYLPLGQPFATLSGGELQRLKVAAHLSDSPDIHTLFILDEPAGGLHLRDIAKLEAELQRLVDLGHSVWFIEHQLDLLKQADWLIELGPGAGPEGGKIVFEGQPSALLKAQTATGHALSVAKNTN